MTIEQIAALAGVSRSTVSRVMNDQPRVSPNVRARVRGVIEERGYAPNAAARCLAGSATDVLCLLTVRGPTGIFTDQFFPPLVRGISEACNANGYYLMLSMVEAAQVTPFYHRVVHGRHCDGIMMLANDVDASLLALLHKEQTPHVLIGCHPDFPELNSVDVENFNGAGLAVRHLLALGHRRIATITGRLNTSPGAERYAGYRAAMRAAGLPELVAEGDLTGASGYRAMGRLLREGERPTAVFAADDAMAAGALRAIREAGLHVPGDIALVGFDDAPTVTLMDPQLTTIRQPIHALGAHAARLLIDQLRGNAAAPVQHCLPVELVIRQSCGTDPGR